MQGAEPAMVVEEEEDEQVPPFPSPTFFPQNFVTMFQWG